MVETPYFLLFYTYIFFIYGLYHLWENKIFPIKLISLM